MRFINDIRSRLTRACAAPVLAGGVLVALCGPVAAHSWYDPDCCSDRDCEAVSTVTYVASDPGSVPVMVVTTSFGTKPVTAKTKIRESKDSRMHACIYQGALICLYMPPGN